MKTALKNMIIGLSLAGILTVGPVLMTKEQNTKVSEQKKEYALQWPLDNFIITQKFGENKNTLYGERGHCGLDLMSYFGAPVKAAADGIIFAKGSDECPNFDEPYCNYGFGNWVMIWHPRLKLHTVYSHLKEPSNKEVNSQVKQGQIIGYEGGSGRQIDMPSGKEVVNDETRHHLDFMVGEFHIYQTFEGKTDFQVVELYNPLKFLPPLK